ncbi:hypothetical protein IIC_04736 [Bacillus cereus VD021]|uniref:Uncharacterized protein n=1 Tax=Bacillus cereus VD021 TaxID=1053224 RepID=R8HBR4_BACCE|nr:hypothetical protein [Bacillus cereus]EOO70294.1 hypothetical protein IIC_04736 [Bacillus cereus VD021]
MIKLKNKKIINLLSFCLLALAIFANSFFSIKYFGVIEQFDKIQMNFPLFTNSFVIVFLTSIQVIVGITVVIIETLFVTFITNFIANRKLKFSNFLSVIIFSNISSILLNMTVIWIVGLNNLQDLEWLGWSPGSQMLLAGFVYLYLSNLDNSIANSLKIKISIIIFSITYGLTFSIQMLMTFV